MGTPETVELTFEEAALKLGEHGMTLTRDGTSDPGERWSVRPWVAPEVWMREVLGDSWPEVVSHALGINVVERNELEELRAAVKEYRDARDWYSQTPNENEAHSRLSAADAVLKSLSENL